MMIIRILDQISRHQILIVRVLAVAILVLLLASVSGQLCVYVYGYPNTSAFVWLFDVDREWNVPAVFQTVQLLLAAFILLIITLLEKARRASYVLHWAVLCAVFVFLAVDELISLHERLVAPMHYLMGPGKYGIFYFSWVIPGMVFVLFFALFFFKFLLHLPQKIQLIFAGAAILYIGGSIGFELIEGRYTEIYGVFNLMHSMYASVEEALEMLGIMIFIGGLLAWKSGKSGTQ